MSNVIRTVPLEVPSDSRDIGLGRADFVARGAETDAAGSGGSTHSDGDTGL